MSTGIGKTQRAILDTLAASEGGNLAVVELAATLGISARQTRRAVHSLAARGLVVLDRRPGGWAGRGEYGPLLERDTGYWDERAGQVVAYRPEVPTAQVRKVLYDDYDDDGKLTYRHYNVQYVHAGMPTGVSRFVWLPEARESARERGRAFREAEDSLRTTSVTPQRRSP